MRPAQAKLEELVRFGEKRLVRARARQTFADREFADARAALLGATSRLVDWIEANPDPQFPLPLAAAPEPTGGNQ